MIHRIGACVKGVGLGMALCFGLAGAADTDSTLSPEVKAERQKAMQAIKALQNQSGKLNAAYAKEAQEKEKARKEEELRTKSRGDAPVKGKGKGAVPTNSGQAPTIPASPTQG